MQLPLVIGVGDNYHQVGTIDIDPKEDPTLALAATLEAVAAEMRLAIRDRITEAAGVDLTPDTDAREVEVVAAPQDAAWGEPPCFCGTDLGALVEIDSFVTEGGTPVGEVGDPNCPEHGEMVRAVLAQRGEVAASWQEKVWERRADLPREAIATLPEDLRAKAVASLATALDVPPELLASDVPADVNHWSHWDRALTAETAEVLGEAITACTPIPCPPFEDVTLNVIAVCNCSELEESVWGNPWGRRDCPMHAKAVERMLRREIEELDRVQNAEEGRND